MYHYRGEVTRMHSDLIINVGCIKDVPVERQLRLFAETGFNGVFFDWSRDRMPDPFVPVARRLGLRVQSLHAPFYGMDDVWHDGGEDKARLMLDDLLACVDSCAACQVPLMICHCIIGMDNHSPNALGLARLQPVVEYAARFGVTIAFENTEGEEYLAAVLARFGGMPNVGFCLDTGHEMCYNERRDLLARYGKYLVSTHLNDNLGRTGEEITFFDDSHMLPFDGTADWNRIAGRLHDCGFDGDLTYEFVRGNRPHRHTNDRYLAMSDEEYVRLAFERCERFRRIFDGS